MQMCAYLFLNKFKFKQLVNYQQIIGKIIMMEDLEQRVNTLAEQWQDYCLPDKTDILKPKLNDFVAEIDQQLEENNENKKQKAKLFYLKGKVLDLLPVYEKSSEELLNKSIKLNPQNGDCWNVLAHILFKKGDYEGASKAVNMAIQTKGKNKVSLRYQSVLLRTQGKLPEERMKNMEESVKIIKEALMMDMQDWSTWYFLGNAYLSNYIVNLKKIDELQNALKAYNEAEKYVKFKYPDLNRNRANVEIHLQEYENAIKDLEAVQSIEPSQGLVRVIENIKKRIEHTKVSFERTGDMKKAKIEELIKTIPNSINKQNQQENKTQIASINALKEKQNTNKMLSAKVLTKLTSDTDIPASFLVIDSQGHFLCVSVFNIRNQSLEKRITKDTLLTVKDPYVRKVRFGEFSYWSVQVFDITKIWADKSKFSKQDFNPSNVYNETFEK